MPVDPTTNPASVYFLHPSESEEKVIEKDKPYKKK